MMYSDNSENDSELEKDSDGVEQDSDEGWDKYIENADSYEGSPCSESECWWKMKNGYLKSKNKHLETTAALLQELCGDEFHFFSEGELCGQDITVEVEGIGNLPFPLNEDRIENLRSISTKAVFENGEETVLNEDVRDTHEVPGKKINVNINTKSFSRMLDKMRSEMGFSDNCVLETELYNMLIYGRGQFFDLHSEKAENMIGTLVIVLPSPHIGGDLVIHHGTKEHTFSSEHFTHTYFKCIGFYADCRHKIEKVKDGFRVVLTYKLILKPKKNKSLDSVNEKLKDAIENYFIETHSRKYVHFLDHSYTDHGLKWNMLKGDDCIKSEALLAVGKCLSLTPHLASVKVVMKQHDDNGRKYPSMANVNKIRYSLSHWVDSNNEVQPFKKYFVHEKEICWTKETSASFIPYEKDMSCFTGNTCFTVGYWYRRAAIVLWPGSKDVVMRVILDPEGAFKELQATMESPGKEEEVKEFVKKYSKELRRKCKTKIADFEKMNQIALYIKDRKMSMSILFRFNWRILSCDIAKSLAKLELLYGTAWCIELLNKWNANEVPIYYSNRETIIKGLHSFVATYLHSGGTSHVVKVILSKQFCDISSMEDLEQYDSEKLKDVVDILNEYISSCTIIENTNLIDKVIQYLVGSSPIFLNTYLADLYLKLKKDLLAKYLIHCDTLKTYLIRSINTELESMTEFSGYWSVKNRLKCGCMCCMEVNRFLCSNTEMKKEWEPYDTHRSHFYVQIQKMRLPIALHIDADRKPLFTLVKNESLRNNKNKLVEELQLILQKLQSTD